MPLILKPNKDDKLKLIFKRRNSSCFDVVYPEGNIHYHVGSISEKEDFSGYTFHSMQKEINRIDEVMPLQTIKRKLLKDLKNISLKWRD